MKKKLIITLLCASMFASMLTACGSSSKGSSSKTETSKKETTVSVEKEDTKKEDKSSKEDQKEEDIEKEENQSEIVEKKYNRENFWDEFKIFADGNEIILGETTLQDLENMGYNFEFTPSPNSYTHIYKDGHSQFNVLTIFKDGADDANDLSINIIDDILIQSRYDVSNCISIGEFTSDTTPEDVYQTLGIPNYFSDEEDLEYEDGKEYEWIYYNDDKGVLLWFLFYGDSEDKDLELSITKGENAKGIYKEKIKTLGRFTSGNDIFRELYPSFVGNEPIEQEAPVISVSNGWESLEFSFNGVKIKIGETNYKDLYNELSANDSSWEMIENIIGTITLRSYYQNDKGSNSNKHTFETFTYYKKVDNITDEAAYNGILYNVWADISSVEEVELELPNGINQNSTSEDIINAYGYPNYIYQNNNNKSYYYVSDDYSKLMSISSTFSDKIYNIQMMDVINGRRKYGYDSDEQIKEQIKNKFEGHLLDGSDCLLDERIMIN